MIKLVNREGIQRKSPITVQSIKTARASPAQVMAQPKSNSGLHTTF